MDFKIVITLLLATSYSRCDSAKDESSHYFELKSPYLLQSSSIVDGSPVDLFDYTNYEIPEKFNERSSETSSFIPKEENEDLRQLLSSSFSNILRSDLTPKQQFLLDRIGSKSHNDNYKLKNYVGNNLAQRRSMKLSNEYKDALLQGTSPLKDNSIAPIPFKKSVQTSMPRKRGKCCTVGPQGWCFSCERDPFEHSDISYEDLKDFASLPLTIVNITNSLAKEKTCENFNAQLIETDLKKYPLITPNWLLRVHYLGMCPFTLQKRYLGPNTLPSQVIEAKCLCKDSTCSKYGGNFRCTAVEYPIHTLVRDGQTDKFKNDLEIVTVACICAQKPSSFAENGNKYFIGDSPV